MRIKISLLVLLFGMSSGVAFGQRANEGCAQVSTIAPTATYNYFHLSVSSCTTKSQMISVAINEGGRYDVFLQGGEENVEIPVSHSTHPINIKFWTCISSQKWARTPWDKRHNQLPTFNSKTGEGGDVVCKEN
jgi:hypothetical protein